VQTAGDLLFVSPTDLTKFLACRHATRLDLAVARGQLARPDEGTDEVLESLFARGLEHEARYLQTLKDRGLSVTDFGHPKSTPEALTAAEAATLAAMESGVDVVYQATFFDGTWRGHADFLVKRPDRPGNWAWSYDVADTKLARRMKVPALLQMATYADRLAELQGIESELLVVVTGDGEERPYAFADCAHYARLVRDQLLEYLDKDVETRPKPVAQCEQCRWVPRCRRQWRKEDDLSLVAFMSGAHSDLLRGAGISTVRKLGESATDDLPATIGRPARERLAAQACLQLVERDTGRPTYKLLAPDEGRGLALLPAPSVGDVFFDIEGDPFIGDHGLEYLLGVVDHDEFTSFWATDVANEKRAFEELVDHLIDAWDHDPDMHVYHYAPYEPTRLKWLSARHDTRGIEIDRLLRGERLVDLYAVVRQGVRISKESYSIKKMEAFYRGHIRQKVGVSDALGSVVAFERWLASGDQALLDDIEKYNEDDCRSTQELRDWLELRRTEGGGDAAYPRPIHSDGLASAESAEVASEVERISAKLVAGISDEDRTGAEAGRVLLAGLLDWHRRESLPEWWEYFARLEKSDEQLVVDTASIGELSAAEHVRDVARSAVWRMIFPPQDTKIRIDDNVLDPRTSKSVGTVVFVDPENGVLELRRSCGRGAPDCTSVVPTAPIHDRDQRARMRALGTWVVEHGIDDPSDSWRAGRDLLLRHVPRVPAAGGDLRRPHETAEAALSRLASSLDRTVLPVQGPPGTGKTWAGARMILRLIGEGKTVGVTAFSHKVIGNLLDAVCAAAADAGQSPRILQKAAEHERCSSTAVVSMDSAADVEAELRTGTVDLVAGTSWLFAREGMSNTVDVLVVDEAGQLSLANVLAVSHAAKSVVLLGDPQQLAQPVKGQHPEGADASALEHLLNGSATVASGRGLLLDTTWRMHSGVASFVSNRFYDGKLRVESGCERQAIESASVLGGTGLRLVPVTHNGNSAASTEEAEIVADLCREAIADGVWVDRDSGRRRVTGADILVLTPFNAQVHRIRTRTDAVSSAIRVGTVDKFQGQEAPIIIYSLASSSASDAPRGLDFLYSLNRLNVAISRARAVMAIVCSEALMTPLVHSPDQLRMVDALCAFASSARLQ
jgi:predicted RecB family nuclease